MTRDWTAPFRTMRIVERLGTMSVLTMDDMRNIQADVRALSADRLLSAVEAAAKSTKYAKADPDTRNVIERLRLWDRQVDARPIVALYQAFLRAMWRRTFADELPPDVFKHFFEYGMSERYVGLHAILDDPTSRWCAHVDGRLAGKLFSHGNDGVLSNQAPVGNRPSLTGRFG